VVNNMVLETKGGGVATKAWAKGTGVPADIKNKTAKKEVPSKEK